MNAATSVTHVFHELLEELAPVESTVNEDVARLKRLTKAIEGGYTVSGAQLMGSHKKGTAVRGVSDIDLFLLLRRDGVRWGKGLVSSKTVLANCRQSIQDSLPYSTVRCDKSAVSVDIARATHHIEVVPAFFDGVAGGFARFRIPDGSGDWLLTAPLAHADWLRKANSDGGNRLKPVVRLLKAWAAARGGTQALSSYYVESALGFANVVGGPWSYSEALYRAFHCLTMLRCQPIADPMQVSDRPVRIARTDQQCQDIREYVDEAYERATQARHEESRGREAAALQRWRQVFNHRWI